MVKLNFILQLFGGFVKNQQKFLGFLMVLIFLLFSDAGFGAVTNSCVTCHTNEALMKAMHKPPPLPASEGEG